MSLLPEFTIPNFFDMDSSSLSPVSSAASSAATSPSTTPLSMDREEGEIVPKVVSISEPPSFPVLARSLVSSAARSAASARSTIPLFIEWKGGEIVSDSVSIPEPYPFPALGPVGKQSVILRFSSFKASEDWVIHHGYTKWFDLYHNKLNAFTNNAVDDYISFKNYLSETFALGFYRTHPITILDKGGILMPLNKLLRPIPGKSYDPIFPHPEFLFLTSG